MKTTFRLSQEQQSFLCLMFETQDVDFAIEKFMLMLADAGVSLHDNAVYLNRIMKRWKDKYGV